MSIISRTPQTSQAVVLFQPSLQPQAFVQREVDKVTKRVLAHLVELALTNAQILSCDVLPNRSVAATIGVIRKLDLRQDQRFDIAKRTLELNTEETVPCIRQFRLNRDQRYELSKIFFAIYPWPNPYFLQFFKLTQDQFFDAAVRCAETNALTPFFVKASKAFSSLHQVRQYIIAMLCAKKWPLMLAQDIQNFNLSGEQRLEIAKVCAKKENLDMWLKNFQLTKEQEAEIQELYTVILDYASVQRSIGSSSEQVMVYGFDHAKYEDIIYALEAPDSPFCKVFDWSFGDPKEPECGTTLEGRAIEEFPTDLAETFEGVSGKRTTARECKAAVTSLVLENFKRKKLGLPLIPLLFCVESPDTAENHKLTVQSLTTKERGTNSLITHRELRRVYKLCKELECDIDPMTHDLARVAQETLKMVRIERPGEKYEMSCVLPVWEQPQWKEAWEKRIQQKSPERHQQERKAKSHYWRDELMARAKMC